MHRTVFSTVFFFYRFCFSGCWLFGLVLNMLHLWFCVLNGDFLSVCLVYTGSLVHCFVKLLENVSYSSSNSTINRYFLVLTFCCRRTYLAALMTTTCVSTILKQPSLFNASIQSETPFVRSHISWGRERIILYKGVKTSLGSPKGKTQRGQYLLTIDLGRYKWYQSQTPCDVPARRLNSKRGWTWGDVPATMLDPEGCELRGPTSIGEGNEYQRGHWAPGREGRGVDCKISHRLGKRTKHSL